MRVCEWGGGGEDDDRERKQRADFNRGAVIVDITAKRFAAGDAL